MRRQQTRPGPKKPRLESILLAVLVIFVILIVLSWINRHFGGVNHLKAHPAVPQQKK